MMQDRIIATWNTTPVIDAKCTHAMALQIAESMAREFVGETQRNAMRDLWESDLLSCGRNKPLPRKRWTWHDDTGVCVVQLN